MQRPAPSNVHKCSGYVSFALNLWLSSRIAYSKLGQGSDPFLFVALDAQAERVRCSRFVLGATLTACVTGAARSWGTRVDMPASRAFFFDSCSAPCLARLRRHHACSPARCRPCSVHRLQYSFVRCGCRFYFPGTFPPHMLVLFIKKSHVTSAPLCLISSTLL